MVQRPFHHGNLRAELLTAAEQTIRAQGVDALSLRDLARQAGVSHAAPRRHFPDRQALLDAMAERGFRSLTEVVESAAAGAGPAYEDRFRSVAFAYVGFAIDQAALMDLMFATKSAAPSDPVDQAATQFFATIASVMDEASSQSSPPLDDRQRLQLLLISTLQGIASLVGSGRFPREYVEQLIDDTTTVFTGRTPGR